MDYRRAGLLRQCVEGGSKWQRRAGIGAAESDTAQLCILRTRPDGGVRLRPVRPPEVPGSAIRYEILERGPAAGPDRLTHPARCRPPEQLARVVAPTASANRRASGESRVARGGSFFDIWFVLGERNGRPDRLPKMCPLGAGEETVAPKS